jgi:hypothetical protein
MGFLDGIMSDGLGLVMMVSETWRVLSKASGRLCVNLWSCGCVPTLDRMSPFNELISGWEIRLNSPSKLGANIKESEM